MSFQELFDIIIIIITIIHCVKGIQIRSFSWYVFFRFRTEYGEIRSISSYSVRMRENTYQKKLRIWTLPHSDSYYIFIHCLQKEVYVI